MTITAQAIRFDEYGGSDVLNWTEVTLAAPQAGEVLVRHKAVGLNYIDTYHRTGLYPVPALPCTPGLEASGVIEAVGDGVEGLAVGDRVAYGTGPLGAYATARLIPADKLVRLPDQITHETAAAMMLKGLTAQYLLRQTFRVEAGQTILFHAAAGGVGLIATQWAKHLGATVIGTAGSEEKAELARAHGADHVILYREQDVAEEVRRITDGKGVPVVYDGVGAATLDASLNSLSPRGLLVSYGNASGPITGFDLGILAAKGSLYITRPTLMGYADTQAAMQAMADDLFAVVTGGHVSININQRFELAKAATAHDALEGRATTGSTLLIP
ncbi:MAG: quinone oxidoreductase [Alphaproteobacteria bacterium]